MTSIEHTCPRCGLVYTERPHDAIAADWLGWCPRCQVHASSARTKAEALDARGEPAAGHTGALTGA